MFETAFICGYGVTWGIASALALMVLVASIIATVANAIEKRKILRKRMR